MVALIPALAVPTLLVRGASPTISAPAAVTVGSTVVVNGSEFTPNTRGVVLLGTQKRAFEVGADGRFLSRLTAPARTKFGTHAIVAVEVDADGRPSRELARTTIQVEARKLSNLVATAAPTVSPTPTIELTTPPPRLPATATPTASPTVAPTEAATAAPGTTSAPRSAPVAPTAPAITPVPATPAPQAPIAKGTGRVFIMAPNGSDSGAGTLASPWLTYGHASKFLAPGDTLYARGGVYHGQGGYSWNPGASGVAGSPIWFAAYPGEVPVFDGGNWQEQFLIFHDQVHHVIVDGLRVQNYHPVQNGILLLIGNSHDIVIQNMVMAGNRGTSATPIEHLIYPGASPYNITIRYNVLDAAGLSGGAIHLYHDPGPRNVLIEGNVIRNGYWGVIVASSANGVTIRNNAFSGNRRANIEVWSSAVNVVVTGNSPNNNVLR